MIGRLIDEGSYAKVYKCIDTNNIDLPLVIKIQEEFMLF